MRNRTSAVPGEMPLEPVGRDLGWQSSRRIARAFWIVAGGYWKGDDKWRGAGLLSLVLAGVLGRVLTVVILNSTNGKFFDSLQFKNKVAFYENSLFVALLLSIQLGTVMLHTFSSQMLEIRWRRWLTNHYIGLWLANESFYRMRFHGRVDNPDQRISEDIRMMISDTSNLTVGFLNAALTVGAFAGVLYTLSGPLAFTVFGSHVTVQGYLLWSAMLYWGLGACFGSYIGNPLIWLNNLQQRLEADFRFALIRVREKAEAIALYGGQMPEESRSRKLFDQVNFNSIRVLLRSMKFLTYQTFTVDAASPLSFILCGPRFFAGAITQGVMMRSANGFGQLSMSLSWVVSAYPTFAEWHATVDRLDEFRKDLEAIRHERPGFERSISKDGSFVLTDLCVARPDGEPMFSDLSLCLRRGEAVLVKGRSGSGKSTLFRALAGIWPFGSGRIESPGVDRILILPQQPYFPIGPLRTALWFPGVAEPDRDEEARAVLLSIGLSQLTTRLDESEHWEQLLSVGEQQRLAIAQALLLQPDWLLMDESTSGLDESQEREMYVLLKSKLRNTTIVSIGHRSSVESFHDRMIHLAEEGQIVPV